MHVVSAIKDDDACFAICIIPQGKQKHLYGMNNHES